LKDLKLAMFGRSFKYSYLSPCSHYISLSTWKTLSSP
jgi:hypothetical protein